MLSYAGTAMRLWHDLDRPIAGRRVPGSVPVMLASAFVGLVVDAFVVPTGFNLAYSDAQSHLTIARRLFDTASGAGIQQLGTVWLPVPHLLLAPMVLSRWMWHTGWGAAVLGSVCLGVTACCVYRSVARWGGGRAARMVGVAVVVINPSMLYLCATALTEPVLIAAMAMCLAGLSDLATRRRISSPGEVAIFCGIPAALAALSRYEGWVLCLTGTIFVAAVVWRRSGSWSRVAAMVAGFAGPPLSAILWWLGYNWVVFHDPLAFFRGQFSANAQQAEIVANGVSTKSDLGASLAALNLAVSSSVGPASIAVAALGVVGFILSKRRGDRGLLLVAAASSYLFLVVALYAGQAIIWNPAVRSGYSWNNRFGMASILPVALLASVGVQTVEDLANRVGAGALRTVVRGAVSVLLVGVLVLQASWFMQRPAERSQVIKEAAVSWQADALSRQAAVWLGRHYDGGRILLDETGSANAQLPQIGLPLRQYYLQADGARFQQALAQPEEHVRWVWVGSKGQDAVRTAAATTSFQRDYRPAFANAAITIYVRTYE
ncbi:hypothetical protein [Propionibacterium freudenreichii]|uniref:hypothetical protein n=1 Tax=Propionibacterium freudenreichii TaxID=1744 RepID=UPI0024344333|nr:hypothetical protein [Propionibacterium freudenreichii]MDK9295398.1 hypothetical protein [Propionibacterium freudenreichii]MDK9302575.1 hypothetical protein [Propionibacterium freudenreichii]MDK9340807.1 hypothetical protein [Propionibacterium freudenreichii]MDK9360788.1 hypothetical protein [Propionibacterium freudenreichii]MDK9639977.1 hypothetical protein [Propionibacterium freudenreichii]